MEQELIDALPHLKNILMKKFRINNIDIEDILQETCLRALAHKHTFKPGKDVQAWCYKISIGVIADFYKHSRDTVSIDQFRDDELPLVEPEQEWNVKCIELHKTIDNFPEKKRQVMQWVMEGKEYKDIACILDRSYFTIGAHVDQARRVLRSIV